jgi:hypothetical protein
MLSTDKLLRMMDQGAVWTDVVLELFQERDPRPSQIELEHLPGLANGLIELDLREALCAIVEPTDQFETTPRDQLELYAGTVEQRARGLYWCSQVLSEMVAWRPTDEFAALKDRLLAEFVQLMRELATLPEPPEPYTEIATIGRLRRALIRRQRKGFVEVGAAKDIFGAFQRLRQSLARERATAGAS